MRNISPEEQAITKRFFEALDMLKRDRIIHGYMDFIKDHDLNQANFSVLMNNQDKRALKPVYLAYLCEDYGISAEWLLTGKGDMFKQTSSRT